MRVLWSQTNEELKIYYGEYYLHNYQGIYILHFLLQLVLCFGEAHAFLISQMLERFLIKEIKLVYLAIMSILLLNLYVLENI